MAIIHQVELQPTKLELLEEWLPHQSWLTESGTAALRKEQYLEVEGKLGVLAQSVVVQSTWLEPEAVPIIET